ncbi:hypothetical protein L596_017703 [Steinernema carpocapsae]|uniref:Uncharacterized protein n=1 Tax=Steinernema carpocapsae TaxID=34508 RepID=A0A4U5N2F2_STECR|nr:hypothetical protein L596_017703 [Steinernema carpocapsae]
MIKIFCSKNPSSNPKPKKKTRQPKLSKNQAYVMELIKELNLPIDRNSLLAVEKKLDIIATLRRSLDETEDVLNKMLGEAQTRVGLGMIDPPTPIIRRGPRTRSTSVPNRVTFRC